MCPLIKRAEKPFTPTMHGVVNFVLEHGYSILFATVFARQIGLPVPAPLFLLATGALAATGSLRLAPGLVFAVIACVLADWAWYEAGRRRGDKVLHFIHGFTRDPDAHDRRAKKTFAKYGPPLLVLAKFVPGLDAVAPPLAGTSRTSRLRFLGFETLGAILWSSVYLGLGYVFSHDLDRAAAYVGRTGRLIAAFALSALAIVAIRKMFLRYRSMHNSRMVPVIPAPEDTEESIVDPYRIINGARNDD